MRTQPWLKIIPIILTGGGALLLGGCSAISTTMQRAGAVGLGSTIGGLAGYKLGNKDPVKTAAGAVLGGVATHVAMGKDPAVLQEGFDQGYVQGQSDAIKRQYFLRQALEQRPAGSGEGETVYYVVPGPTVTADGRQLKPHEVAVRVVE
ncbi:MAG TPA: hypothetical protein VMC06_02375 [Opitutaceae bacterium]|nr:hypothetical protein [Opitutaceae bacterium]